MKAVIFAGGLGTRLSEETAVRPKPMVEIGTMPVLWHIMKIYSHHGINDFIICCGYKGHIITEFFANYRLRNARVLVDLQNTSVDIENNDLEPWKIALVDTGESTMTGGRLRRVSDLIGSETFCLTYGDGVGDIDVTASLEFHRQHGRLATMTAVQPPGRFGAFTLADDEAEVLQFREKPEGDGAWINGGFFVCEPQVMDYIESDKTVWEREPMTALARDNQLMAFKHSGFWQPMDTLRDKNLLDDMWSSGKADWKVW